MTEQQLAAKQMQEDFAYIINGEKSLGIETKRDKITHLYHHGGTVSEYYREGRVEATMPKDQKYLDLKAKYFGDVNMSLFFPSSFKKELDNNNEI